MIESYLEKMLKDFVHDVEMLNIRKKMYCEHYDVMASVLSYYTGYVIGKKNLLNKVFYDEIEIDLEPDVHGFYLYRIKDKGGKKVIFANDRVQDIMKAYEAEYLTLPEDMPQRKERHDKEEWKETRFLDAFEEMDNEHI